MEGNKQTALGKADKHQAGIQDIIMRRQHLKEMQNIGTHTSTWPAWKRSKAPSIYTIREFGPGPCKKCHTDQAIGSSVFYATSVRDGINPSLFRYLKSQKDIKFKHSGALRK